MNFQTNTFGDGTFRLRIDPQTNFADGDVGVESSPKDNRGIFSRNLARDMLERRGSAPDLNDCYLQALLPGFETTPVRLKPRNMAAAAMDVLVLRRSEAVSGGTVSLTTLAAPKKARKAYEKAQKELEKESGKVSKALRELEQAVKLDHEFSAAWFLLGRARWALQEIRGARKAYEESIRTDHTFVPPYLELALLELGQENWERTCDLSARVIEMDPSLTKAHYINAAASLNLGRLEVAERSIARVRKAGDPELLAASHYVN